METRKKLPSMIKPKELKEENILNRSYKYSIVRGYDYISSNKNKLPLPCPT